MFKLKVLAKIILITLFIICFYGMPFSYYQNQRFISFLLFLFIAIADGLAANYISFVIGVFGVILFNPFYLPGFNGATWDTVERWLIGVVNVWVLADIYFYINKGKTKTQKKARVLKYLKLNENTGMYEVYDGGYKYEISPELIEDLHIYMHHSRIGLIGDWYMKLSREERPKVRKLVKVKG